MEYWKNLATSFISKWASILCSVKMIMFLVSAGGGLVFLHWYFRQTRIMSLEILGKAGVGPNALEAIVGLWTQVQLVAIAYLTMLGVIVGAIVVVREAHKISKLKIKK